MKREWRPDELIEHWTILPGERKLIGNKHGSTRLGFAVLLKYFQHEGRFPRQPYEIPFCIVEYIAQQVNVEPTTWEQYSWNGRSIEYHRAQIRQQLGFREASVADGEDLVSWLGKEVLTTTHRPEHLKEAFYQRCREIRIEPPTPDRVERLIRSALQQFENQLGERVLHRLSPVTRKKLDALLTTDEVKEDDIQTSNSHFKEIPGFLSPYLSLLVQSS